MRVLFDDFSAYTQYQLGYVKSTRLVFPRRDARRRQLLPPLSIICSDMFSINSRTVQLITQIPNRLDGSRV